MTKEFNLSDYIQYKDLDDFNCEFIDVKKIKKFIRLFKLEINKEKIIEDFMVSRKEIFAIMDKLAGDKLK